MRWSKSTEIGDFIRDAARGQEFAIEIEGAPHDIRVGVPSFNDRTYYLRMRLRSTSKKIADLADIKKECDQLAHKGAQRVAIGGLGLVVAWWGTVYKLTFDTDLGWDVMEPVTVSCRKLSMLKPPDPNQSLIVSCWAQHFDWWLCVVPLPQPRGILPISNEHHHLTSPAKAIQ